MRSSNACLLRLLVTAYGFHASAQIDLGAAIPYGITANTAITNTGNTLINGRLALANFESSITGFPPGISDGVDAANDAARLACEDSQTAYNAAAALVPTSRLGGNLGNRVLSAGTYAISSSADLNGVLVLDGLNNLDSQFVFQIGSTLTTASASTVSLVNGAQACNIFWQVGSSATLGTDTVFAGNILAFTSITLNDGVSVNGGLYALYGAVTLINDLVAPQQECAVQPVEPPPYSEVVSSTSTITSGATASDATTAGGLGSTTTLSEGGSAAFSTSSSIDSSTTATTTSTTASPPAASTSIAPITTAPPISSMPTIVLPPSSTTTPPLSTITPPLSTVLSSMTPSSTLPSTPTTSTMSLSSASTISISLSSTSDRPTFPSSTTSSMTSSTASSTVSSTATSTASSMPSNTANSTTATTTSSSTTGTSTTILTESSASSTIVSTRTLTTCPPVLTTTTTLRCSATQASDMTTKRCNCPARTAVSTTCLKKNRW